MKFRSLLALLALAAAPAFAQLAAPNDAGVAMGHIHLLVKDMDAQKKFWTMFGGKCVKNGQLGLIELPGAYIMLRQGDPSGGTVGSAVNHFGVHVPVVNDFVARFRAAGFMIEQPRDTQAYITGPDGVRIEVLEDKTITSPVVMHHIHIYAAAPLDVQAWYVKNFGAIAGKRLMFDTATIPGVEIATFKDETQLAPTKGRSLDHIGFEVKNLEAFVKKLEASGIKMDAEPRQLPNSTVKVAFLTDPFGTYIELTENLAPKP